MAHEFIKQQYQEQVKMYCQKYEVRDSAKKNDGFSS